MIREKVQLLIITGMSGAGKSQAIKCLEDMGFFCVDNLPVMLLPKFGELCKKVGGNLKKTAIGIDIRAGKLLGELQSALSALKHEGIDNKIIFFDADDQTLLQRYSETRRRHPLGKRVIEGIAEERKLLRNIKAIADRICDTSHITLNELREILNTWILSKENDPINLIIMSFGYKYGLPPDADIIIDVRFLPNPNYIKSLKQLTGKDKQVKNYLMRFPSTKLFLKRFIELLNFMLPRFLKEGKLYITIALGCTGGQHRSVVLAGKTADMLASRGYQPRIIHRDVNR